MCTNTAFSNSLATKNKNNLEIPKTIYFHKKQVRAALAQQGMRLFQKMTDFWKCQSQ